MLIGQFPTPSSPRTEADSESYAARIVPVAREESGGTRQADESAGLAAEILPAEQRGLNPILAHGYQDLLLPE